MATDRPPLVAEGDTGQQAALRQGFTLGEHSVVPASASIHRADTTVHLSDRAMQVLVYLAAKAGSVVTPEALERSIDPGKNLPAGELSHCVAEIREALGDDGLRQKYLQTLAGSGYRLLLTPVPGSGGDQSTPSDAPGKITAAANDPAILRSFWTELRQRRVFRVSAAYIVVVWAIVQAADVILPIMGLPEWLITVILLIGLLAFPAVVLVAWTTQWDRSGLHLDLPRKQDSDRSYRHLYLLMIVSIFATTAVLSMQLFERVSEQSQEVPLLTAQGSVPETVADNSIAVLRFANLSGEQADSYFSDGLSEELLTLLARLRELRVASRSSSWSLPVNVDIDSLRKRLRVAYVLEGSVRRSADKVRITAQLIDTSDGFQLWSQTYDREIQDILSVQAEIARKVASALQILITADTRAALDQRQTANPEAYEAYLKGMQYLRMPVDNDVLLTAEQFFLNAKSIDPSFALAWAGLCKTYLDAYALSESAGDFGKAESACHRTLTLDETRPDIFEALGRLYALSGQHGQAEQSYRRALVLAPGASEALIGLGDTLTRTGASVEAEKHFREAIKADPGYWKAYNALGTWYFRDGRARDAIPYLRQVVLLAPNFPIGLNNLGAAYFLSGQYALATQAFAESIAIKPNKYAYSNSGTALFMLRKFDEAARMYRLALELAPEDYLLWGNLGDALSHQDNPDQQSKTAYERASELAAGLRDINPHDPSLNVALARYLARLGRQHEARRMIATLDDMELDMYVYYDLSLTYITLGEFEAAMAAAEDAIDAGYEVSAMMADPGFDALRSIPAFRRLTETRKAGDI